MFDSLWKCILRHEKIEVMAPYVSETVLAVSSFPAPIWSADQRPQILRFPLPKISRWIISVVDLRVP